MRKEGKEEEVGSGDGDSRNLEKKKKVKQKRRSSLKEGSFSEKKKKKRKTSVRNPGHEHCSMTRRNKNYITNKRTTQLIRSENG